MPYEFLDDIATADVAFKASGKTLEELFSAAGDAVLNVMLEDIGGLALKETQEVALDAENAEMLLFKYLQELVFLKDARLLFLRASDLNVQQQEGGDRLTARLRGEKIDPRKHRLNVDIKAVTLHRFRVQRTGDGWEATVVLDI